MKCYTKSLKSHAEKVRPQLLSLRQDALSGHSFSCGWRRSKDRRMRAFPPIVRTTGTRPEAHFGPFSASLRPLSLTQPNHGRFGTDVGSSTNQLVTGMLIGPGFERAALRRSKRGSNNSIRYGCRADRNRAPRGVAGADRRGARLGPSRERPPAERARSVVRQWIGAGRPPRLVVHRSCEAYSRSGSLGGVPPNADVRQGLQRFRRPASASRP
jgi:hypothetical protein